MSAQLSHSPESQAKCERIANTWIASFSEAIELGDVKAFVDCIEPQGWFRDLLTFSWDFKSLHGQEAVAAYLSKTNGLNVADLKISNVRFEDTQDGRPHIGHLGHTPLVEAVLRFETPRAQGKGYMLIPFSDSNEAEVSKPRAFVLLLMINDWKGHEELGYESGNYDGHNLSWEEVRTQRREEVEKDPSVIIIGAGQTGLQVAARFRQMNIKALIVEKNSRVGDNWRVRYPTLALHSPRKHHSLLYQPYPSNWPKFTPKEKMAFWLEQYSQTQDLVIWLESTVEPGPTYDSTARKWTVIVNRKGELIKMHPSHIVVATGIFGEPRLPVFPNQESFEGQMLHSGAYAGGAPFAGKRVVVVGAGNSGADVCQDLVFRGASSVTMIQRSESGIVSDKLLAIQFDPIYSDAKPQEYVDLAALALPINALREFMQKMMPFIREYDMDMRDGLKKAGFKVNDGREEAGQLLMVFDRGGGYFVDVGCAKLIINGSVKVKQGSGIEKLTAHSVVFDDGSETEADAIILATGWHSARDAFRKMFGDEMIDRTAEIWGVDNEGEIRSGYKPSGQPGLWFAAGAFEFSRFYSKQLALFIKAQELGFL